MAFSRCDAPLRRQKQGAQTRTPITVSTATGFHRSIVSREPSHSTFALGLTDPLATRRAPFPPYACHRNVAQDYSQRHDTSSRKGISHSHDFIMSRTPMLQISIDRFIHFSILHSTQPIDRTYWPMLLTDASGIEVAIQLGS